MSKSNNKEKITYKQMLGYLEFMNNKLNEGCGELEQRIIGISACLRSLVLFLGKEEEFAKFLEKKQKEAEEASRKFSETQDNVLKMEKKA